jgi:hypothetical protein
MAFNQSEHALEEGDSEIPDYVGNDDDVPNDDTLGSYEYIDFYSTKDIVESDLEEEDEDEVDQDNDDEDSKAFCLKNRTFNLDDEPKDVRLGRFRQRMENILRFRVGKGEEAVSGDFDPDDKWFCNEFVQPASLTCCLRPASSFTCVSYKLRLSSCSFSLVSFRSLLPSFTMEDAMRAAFRFQLDQLSDQPSTESCLPCLARLLNSWDTEHALTNALG